MIELHQGIIEEALYQADLSWSTDDEDGGFDGHGYNGYSGRAMYGDECFAVVHRDVRSLLKFVAAIHTAAEQLGEEHEDTTDLEWIALARQDEMGLGVVTYFPGVVVAES